MTTSNSRSDRLAALAKIAKGMKSKKIPKGSIENALNKHCRIIWGLSSNSVRDYVRTAMEIEGIE